MKELNIKRKRVLCSVVMAIITVIAFTIKLQVLDMEQIMNWSNCDNAIIIFLSKWRFVINGYGMQNVVLTILLAIFYWQYFYSKFKLQIMKNKDIFVGAFFLSVCMILGQSFQVDNSWNLVFKGWFYISVTIVRLIGYTFFFYVVLRIVVSQLYDKKNIIYFKSGEVGKISYFIFERHAVLIPFGILILCWLPYLISCFPGVVQWDGLRQLTNAFHLASSDNSHPVFTSLLMGGAMKLGRLFGSDNLGVFFYILPQMLIAAGVTAYSINQFRYLKSPYWLRWGTLIYFAFISLWPLYAVSMFKDTLYYIVFLEYIILIIQSLLAGEEFWKNKKKVTIFVCIILLLELIRPNGLYVIVLCMPFVILAGWKGKRNYRGWISVCVAVGLYFAFNHIIVPALGVAPGRINEAFSIPFQQTARYVCEYTDEVTEEEEKIISSVLDYETLLNYYNPEQADPVKNSFNLQASSSELKEYFRVWFQQLRKHPGVYIEATLNGSYGYFFPNKTECTEGLGQYRITDDPRINTGEFDVAMISELEPIRKGLENISYIIRMIPGIGLLFSNGIYTWITIISIIIVLRKYNWKYIVPYLPLLVTILICIASPVNAYIRYMRPVMVATPILLGWLLYLCTRITSEKEVMDTEK